MEQQSRMVVLRCAGNSGTAVHSKCSLEQCRLVDYKVTDVRFLLCKGNINIIIRGVHVENWIYKINIRAYNTMCVCKENDMIKLWALQSMV